MKKLLVLFSFAAITVVFVQCASKKTTTTTEMSDEAKVAEVKKNYSDEQLAEGKTLWETKCNKCHKLYAPDSRTVSKWENILPRMNNRSKLDEKQGALVRAYILANTKA